MLVPRLVKVSGGFLLDGCGYFGLTDEFIQAINTARIDGSVQIFLKTIPSTETGQFKPIGSFEEELFKKTLESFLNAIALQNERFSIVVQTADLKHSPAISYFFFTVSHTIIEQETIVKNTTTVTQSLIDDAAHAALRTMATQFMDLTRDGLLALLMQYLSPEGDATLKSRLTTFLKTPLGESALCSVLSLGLSVLPKNDLTEPLSRELRVRTMTKLADMVADIVTEPLRRLMIQQASDRPTAPKALNKPVPRSHSVGARRKKVGV